MSEDTAQGKGDSFTRKEHVRELLNFFPVIGEDENGEMIGLDAEKVLSIPRRIKSKEVVRRGFMSDFLFQNISNVFHAPQEVLDIITAIAPAKEPVELTTNTGQELSLNDDGEVELDDELVIGVQAEVFGEKILASTTEMMEEVFCHAPEEFRTETEEDRMLDELQKALGVTADAIVGEAEAKYGTEISKSTKNAMERRIKSGADNIIKRAADELKIQKAKIESDMKKEIEAAETDEEEREIKEKYAKEKKKADDGFKTSVTESAKEFVKKSEEEIVRRVETDKKEAKKRSIEDGIKDHLRGFSRTIPSFLMAYGEDNEITLENFDTIVPDNVFTEVTSITLAQFCFLRDGGHYKNAETGEEEYFKGHLFDPVVFNDSVKEFLSLKKRLANYFDEANEEDIFDYIPPQKTNQIFTPKRVVIDMVDRLENENPGCFDDPDKTFADLYMKSGMYIAEIVKRLYNSERMKTFYPDNDERIRHIFEKQVYGLAPTEIIYRICVSYILGFGDKTNVGKHNIKLCDSLKYAKDGTLGEKLKEVFGIE